MLHTYPLSFILTALFGLSAMKQAKKNIEHGDEPILQEKILYSEILARSSKKRDVPIEIHALISRYLYGTQGFLRVYEIKEDFIVDNETVAMPILTRHKPKEHTACLWIAQSNNLCTATCRHIYQMIFLLDIEFSSIKAYKAFDTKEYSTYVQKGTLKNKGVLSRDNFLSRSASCTRVVVKDTLFSRCYFKDGYCDKHNASKMLEQLEKKNQIYVFEAFTRMDTEIAGGIRRRQEPYYKCRELKYEDIPDDDEDDDVESIDGDEELNNSVD